MNTQCRFKQNNYLINTSLHEKYVPDANNNVVDFYRIRIRCKESEQS